MVSVAAPSRRPVSRASRVDELRARGCAMDDPPYCGGFACCRDVTPSVFPHMTFLLDGVNLTIAGDAYGVGLRDNAGPAPMPVRDQWRETFDMCREI